MLTGVFALNEVGGHPGLIEGAPHQLLLQAEGIVTTILYSGVVSFIILKLIDLTMGLRVNKEEEVEGLDVAQHGEVLQHFA
jgi:Amt family ammonium transporter